ncbi:hypothetical protein [Alkalilimnicola sp. S0819]|uniref:hypothetical protein n=1 Tax=Alkalilimnicola sp. S0819 TaxID=2613922 RepID=UPI0012619402|nr:hypothetical protein [Alkalilimnicola sp. S0819]KAB7619677.1 hypothetical protein F3N43_12910 [Alkalilimnicola sp. S0819]MPQ17533.1 hypothetical protein [Alkalilimnicola sp. S0819]
MSIVSELPREGATLFVVLSRLAARHNPYAPSRYKPSIQRTLAAGLPRAAVRPRQGVAFQQAERDHLCAHPPGYALNSAPPPALFSHLLEYSRISDEPHTRLTERRARGSGGATTPASVFSRHLPVARWLRACFAKDGHTPTRAAATLRAL